MKKVETHYDILKVSRDAPDEVIRAAYRSLSQKYHPDKNQGSADSERMMQLINIAYQTLSNPELRKEHDQWINEQEQKYNKDQEAEEPDSFKEDKNTNNKHHESQEEVIPKKENKNNHPWRRFFARTVDIMSTGLILFLIVVFLTSVLFPHSSLEFLKNSFVAGFIAYCLWIPVEAGFLSTIGTTPAKWVFGISVLSEDGSKLSYLSSLKRTLLLFFNGEGLGIPIITLVTRVLAYIHLEKTGTTSWDESACSVVHHKQWGFFRAIASSLLVVLTLMLIRSLNSLDTKPRISQKNNYSMASQNTFNKFPAQIPPVQYYQKEAAPKPAEEPMGNNFPSNYDYEKLKELQEIMQYSSNQELPPTSELQPVVNSNQSAPAPIPPSPPSDQFYSVPMPPMPSPPTSSQYQYIYPSRFVNPELVNNPPLPDHQGNNTNINNNLSDPAPLLTPTEDSEAKFKVTIKTIRANIRNSPGKGDNILGTVQQNDVLNVVGTSGDYYLVSTSIGRGFIHKSTVQDSNTTPPAVANTQINLIAETMNHLPSDDKISIEMACASERVQGAATYRRCLNDQINQLKGTRPVDLSGLLSDDKISIEMACASERVQGAAAYRGCLQNQLNQLRNAF